MDPAMHALEIAHPDSGTAAHQRRFEALYRDEFAFVWSVARHLGVAPMVIEDLVQDVFLTAYRRLDHLRYEVSPRAWLFGVTRRIAFRYRRGEARRTRQYHALAELARSPDDTPQQRHDDARQLERLLERLSDISRTVWEMTELLGMSAPEIASELGVPLNTVYSRLRLARAQLQALADAAGLGALRDDARRRQEPPAAAQQRSWALLLPVLGDQSVFAGVAAWMKAQSAVATTMLTTGVVAVGLAVSRSPAGPPAASGPMPAATPIVEAVRPAVARSVPESVAPEAAVAPEEAVAPAPFAAERRSPAKAAPRSSDMQARLREEIVLIDRAHLQFAGHDEPAALATLALHAQRFPAGVFADVREAAHIDILCRRGDAAGAEALARRLRVDHPESAVAQRFADYLCTPVTDRRSTGE